MVANIQIEESEIDLGELFMAVWSQKILIAIITGISIYFAGQYVLTTPKQYTANAIFKVEANGNNSGINIPGDLGALAVIAGLNSSSTSGTELLMERLASREFILSANKEFSLEADPFFNSYTPDDLPDPAWKALIKKIIGWETSKAEKDAIIKQNVLLNYRQYIRTSPTKAGALSITVTHKNPELAAYYANGLMEKTHSLIIKEQEKASVLRLSYLSETLADALEDMEKAQKNLKNFALKNNARANESFLSGSIKLNKLRMELKDSNEIFRLLKILDSIVKKENLDDISYNKLRKNYPLVDDVRFRRIMGMSETISAWKWPDIKTIKATAVTLSDRIKRLNVEISDIEGEAKIYASSAEELAKLNRDAKIAEATYTVLIEQVKSQTLAAGFKPNTFKVFEYATPPLSPSKPNRKIILLVGAIFGIFAGTVLSILTYSVRGVYYSRKALVRDIGSNISLRSNKIQRISRKSIAKIKENLRLNRSQIIEEAMIDLSNEKLIYCLNFGSKLTASGITRMISTYSALSGRKVALCDLTGRLEEDETKESEKKNGDLLISEPISGLNVIKKNSFSEGVPFFTSANLNERLEKLLESYDQVFICCPDKEAIAGLNALKAFDPYLILLARLRKTQKRDLRKLESIYPVGVLFHD